MKVGDLVTYAFQTLRWQKGQSVDVGLVIETGKYPGNADVLVLWGGSPHALTQKSSHLRVINESR